VELLKKEAGKQLKRNGQEIQGEERLEASGCWQLGSEDDMKLLMGGRGRGAQKWYMAARAARCGGLRLHWHW
jgi:hypothetical protein